MYFVCLLLMVISANVNPVLSMQGTDSIILVQTLYRHGDRTPFVAFEKDPYRDYWLEIGVRELTNKGKLQEYELGQLLRERYGSFIGDVYRYDEVYVRSTDTCRTLASALCNLAGMFPPSGNQVWSHQLPWQPIPVHTVPLDVDRLLNSDSKCDRYYEIMLANNQSAAGIKFYDKNAKLIRKMEDYFGASLKTWDDVWNAVNTFLVEEMNNMPLDEWVYRQWENIVQLDIDLFAWYIRDPEQKRLRGGPLLTEIIRNIKKKINDPEDKSRLFAYSAHDSTITAFMGLLEMYDNDPPGYASCIVFELHYINNHYVVQMLYRSGPEGKFEVLTLPGCTALCPLKSLEKLTRRLVVHNIKEECRATSRKQSTEIQLEVIPQ